jgi:hypothetical protein
LDLSNICDVSNEAIKKCLFPLLDIEGDGLFRHFQAPRVNLGGTHINSETLQTLLQNNKNLRELNLRGCEYLFSIDFILPQLTYLNIINTRVRPETYLAALPNLRTIVGNENIYEFGRVAPNLERIHFRCMRYYRYNNTFSVIADSKEFPRVKYIDLDASIMLYNNGLENFFSLKKLPKLEKLILISPTAHNTNPPKEVTEIKYETLAQLTRRELVATFGDHFTFNDFERLPPSMIELSMEQIQSYDINLNLFVESHGKQWIRNNETLKAVLDTGSDFYYWNYDYQGRTLETVLQDQVSTLIVALNHPRTLGFNFSNCMSMVCRENIPSKEEVIRTLAKRYEYHTDAVAQILCSVVQSNDGQLQTFKLLEELFDIAEAMKELVCIEVIQRANEETLKYILEKGYANEFVKHVPNFEWLPNTYNENDKYKPTIEYLFPSAYKNGKAVDPDVKLTHRDISRQNTPTSIKDAMIDVFVVTRNTKQTRLHYAAERDNVTPHLLAVLMSSIPTNAVNKKKETALRALFRDIKYSDCVRCMLLHKVTLDIPSNSDNETVISRIKDFEKMNKPIKVKMQIERGDTKQDIKFVYDDHQDSDRYLEILLAAGAIIIQIEKNSYPETESKLLKLHNK